MSDEMHNTWHYLYALLQRLTNIQKKGAHYVSMQIIILIHDESTDTRAIKLMVHQQSCGLHSVGRPWRFVLLKVFQKKFTALRMLPSCVKLRFLSYFGSPAFDEKGCFSVNLCNNHNDFVIWWPHRKKHGLPWTIYSIYFYLFAYLAWLVLCHKSCLSLRLLMPEAGGIDYLQMWNLWRTFSVTVLYKSSTYIL